MDNLADVKQRGVVITKQAYMASTHASVPDAYLCYAYLLLSLVSYTLHVYVYAVFTTYKQNGVPCEPNYSRGTVS